MVEGKKNVKIKEQPRRRTEWEMIKEQDEKEKAKKLERKE